MINDIDRSLDLMRNTVKTPNYIFTLIQTEPLPAAAVVLQHISTEST